MSGGRSEKEQRNAAYSLLHFDDLEDRQDESPREGWFRRFFGEPFLISAGLLKLGIAWWAFKSVSLGGVTGVFSTELALGIGWAFVGIGAAQIFAGVLAYRSTGTAYTVLPAILAMATLVTFPLDYLGYASVRR